LWFTGSPSTESGERQTKERCIECSGSWAALPSLVHLSDVDDGSGTLVEIGSARVGEAVDLALRTVDGR
jgi:hypothetical protein